MSKWKECLENWMFLLHPNLTSLLTASHGGRETITPIAWLMPLSGEPPLVALAVKEARFSYQLLKKAGAFVLNIPFFQDAAKVWACGTSSGAQRDKFALTGFTRLAAETIKAPIIAESAAYLECVLHSDLVFGDHHLVVGEVKSARVKQDLFTDRFLDGFSPCLHLRKNLFLTADWAKLFEASSSD